MQSIIPTDENTSKEIIQVFMAENMGEVPEVVVLCLQKCAISAIMDAEIVYSCGISAVAEVFVDVVLLYTNDCYLRLWHCILIEYVHMHM